MKKLLIFILLLLLLATPIVALASDISGALWYGTILISNNSTVATNVATTANISTENLIAGNFLNAYANNTVMRNSSGADVVFMPGFTDANLWCMWVPSIGADSYLTYILYTANSTGGKIRYFPAAGGMETADSGTLELGNNYTIEQKGWVDTTAINSTLINKLGAFSTFIEVSGNITSRIWDSANQTTQTTRDFGENLHNGGFIRCAQRLDDWPVTVISEVQWYLGKGNNPTGLGYARVRRVSDDSIIGTLGSYDVSLLGAGAAWITFNTNAVVNDTVQDIYVTFEYNDGDGANFVHFGVSNNDLKTGVYSKYQAAWADDGAKDACYKISAKLPIQVSATGISSGERTVITSSNNTIFALSVDGVEYYNRDHPALSVVDTPDIANSLVCSSGFQRNLFYIHDLHWVFYSTSAGLYYKTSSNGTNWSAANLIRAWIPGEATPEGGLYDITCDGTNFHYVYSTDGVGKPIYYRMGTPDANGNITWLAAEQTVRNVGAERYRYPTISTNSSGYPWIGFQIQIVGSNVTASTTKNGVWTTHASFPIGIDNDGQSVARVLEMDNDDVYIVYTDAAGDQLKGRKYTSGVGLGAAENIDLSITKWGNWSATCNGTDIFVGYNDGGAEFASRTAAGAWTADVVVGPAVEKVGIALSSAATGDVRVYTASGGDIYYRDRLSGIWQTAVKWIDETETLRYYSVASEKAMDGIIAYAYTTLAAPPCNLKYNFDYTIPIPDVIDNSENYTYYENMCAYWEYTKITIDGVLQQHIEWEYSDNFTDLSGQGHNAIPTFRAASCDSDVSANMTAFLPVAEAKAPDYALGTAPPFIDPGPNITGNFTTTPPTGGFPLAGVIVAIANATSTPAQLPLLIIAGFIILAASLCMSAIMRKSGSGSIVVKIITIVAFMGIFIALRNFGIDFWMLVVFAVIGTAMAMASRHFGWT